jgi:hypothetical protein
MFFKKLAGVIPKPFVKFFHLARFGVIGSHFKNPII